MKREEEHPLYGMMDKPQHNPLVPARGRAGCVTVYKRGAEEVVRRLRG